MPPTRALLLLAAILGPSAATAQTHEIVLLGTSHFAGSAADERTSEVDDVLSPDRQRELDDLADRLARWDPDAVYLECSPARQARFDSLYAAYRTGTYDPTEAGHRNEIYQLGFRAAHRAGLTSIACVDAAGMWLHDPTRRVAQVHSPDLWAELEAYLDRFDWVDEYLRTHTLREYLLELNTDGRLYENHGLYNYFYVRMGTFDGSGLEQRLFGDLGGLRIAFGADVPGWAAGYFGDALPPLNAELVADPRDADILVTDVPAEPVDQGDDGPPERITFDAFRDELLLERTSVYVGFPDHHIGADLVGEWYKRNLRIYANIWRDVAAADVTRAVFLVGQAHVWTLRDFLTDNPDFRVVPVAAVLGPG